ncbi:retron Ec67 family RNA-directed DNA polymerase/endonuclease [Bacillus cereus group sp. MYBK40-2]|uniref:retron Ec67 family RNA-directed DNA polymerase/endonuclease n=1 Tax=unclassified Bacillus cereus group TaxID=2750818 RepID=UPI002A0B3393|nr:retron Ec67 family RNA-directed DNA polymerase/endonuclease [Bacillus cereus]
MNKFNDIKTRDDLSNFLKIPISKLTYILYKKKTSNLYTSFEIPKKNGGVRHIKAPMPDLKEIQKKLALALWTHQEQIWKENGIKPNISHAFQKDKDIITNAQIHRNKRFVLNIDLENFFDSFHFGRVRGFFEKNKHFLLPQNVATIIAQLTCCHEGPLPQGAPSSPIITNLICNILDMKLLKISKKYKLNYTRYADDLTFSTNNKQFLNQQSDFHEEISKIIEKAGFKINEKKTRLQFKDSRQEVTGLIVNKKINVDRNYYKTTRSMAHSLYTTGAFEIDGKKGDINQLEGRFAFINQLDRYNNNNKSKSNDKTSKLVFHPLNSREKQYQKFLLYKYFFANNKPLIVTEGKTDIDYIKSALKKLYIHYPNLVTKNNDGTFEFKVSFLNRTKRLRYFLGIQQDGADTMKNIYSYFNNKSKDRDSNHFTKLQKSGFTPTNPIIFILDNELSNKDKPLKKFTNHIKLDKDKTKQSLFETNYYLNITSNLYLLTHQLVRDLPECEIEDLFDDLTLNHQINGKKFERNTKDFDSKIHYSKAKFAEYISQNYNKINFDNFKCMLDNLNTIVNSYGNS